MYKKTELGVFYSYKYQKILFTSNPLFSFIHASVYILTFGDYN